MRDEYRTFLLKIARKLSTENLESLKFLCVDFIPYTRLPRKESTLTEVFDFFYKLEEQNKIDIDDLHFLKKQLEELNREDLAIEVTRFQFKREAYLSSLGVDERESERSETTRRQQLEHQEEEQRRRSEPEDREDQQAVANQTNRGTIVMRCVPFLATGVWVAGSVYILNRYKEDPEALAALTESVVLPIGTFIKSLFPGSINFLLQATDLNSLKELWKRYQSGRLKKDLQKVLVTEELKNLAKGEPIDLVVTISEQEYRNACLDLMVAQTKAQVLYKEITSSQHAIQLSRSLPDLTSLDTIQNLSGDSLLVQLFDELKMRQNARVERLSSTVWSTENVSSLLEQINSIQFEITSIEVLTGKSCYGKTSSMGHHTREREVYDRVKSTNLGFWTFMDQLEEAKMFLKNERFLLDPQEAVKRLVLFASRIKHYGFDDDHLKIALEEIFNVRPLLPTFRYRGKLRASVRAVVMKVKEMAELLVKIFKLNQELLQDLDLLMLSDSDEAMGELMGFLPFFSPPFSMQETEVPKEATKSVKHERTHSGTYYLDLFKPNDSDEAMGELLKCQRLSPPLLPEQETKVPKKATKSVKGKKLKCVQRKEPLQKQTTVVHSRSRPSLRSSRLRSSRRELEIPSPQSARKASPALDKANKIKIEEET